jgi:hypothetical protein
MTTVAGRQTLSASPARAISDAVRAQQPRAAVPLS